MASKPILTTIIPFDAREDYSFTFSWADGLPQKTKLVIKDNATNAVVYNQEDTTTCYQYKHVTPAGSLTNGYSYNAVISVYSKLANGTYIEDSVSDSIIFSCYSTPTFSFINLETDYTIQNGSFNAKCMYHQPEGEPLDKWWLTVYDISQTEEVFTFDERATGGLAQNFSSNFTGEFTTLEYKGEWDEALEYSFGDVVNYTLPHASNFVAIKDASAGVLPGNADIWTPVLVVNEVVAGLKSETQYYFRAQGLTKEQIPLDTGYIKVSCRYDPTIANSVVTLTNCPEIGAVQVNSAFKKFVPTASSTPIFIDDDELDLRTEGTYISFSDNLNIRQGFSLQIYVRALHQNKLICSWQDGDIMYYLHWRAANYEGSENLKYWAELTSSAEPSCFYMSDILDLEDPECQLYFYITKTNMSAYGHNHYVYNINISDTFVAPD